MTQKDAQNFFLFEDSAQAAIKRLESCLRSSFEDVSEISPDELKKFHPRSFLRGWKLPILAVEDVKLLLLLDERFPFSSPRLAISPPPPILQYPHIENDGVFCIDEEGQTNKAVDTSEMDALRIIQEGAELLKKLQDKKFCDEEFRREFLSYWSRGTSRKSPTIYSILSPDGASRKIVIWKHKEKKQETWLAAESKKQAISWLTGFYGEMSFFKKDKRFTTGYFLRCKNPPIPSEYPETNKDVLNLEGLKTDIEVNDFCRTFSHLPGKIDVVLGFEVQNGFAPVAITIDKGIVPPTNGYLGDYSVSRLVQKEKMELKAIGQRYFEYSESLKLARHSITRADHAWVHGRDKNKEASILQKKKVAFIGMGSIGSTLAIYLAKSGLGSGILIDPQRLGFENIPRHQLGGFDVETIKAAGVYKRIRKSFPHLDGYKVIEGKWENAHQQDPTIFDDCDLIIVTTGGHGSAGAQISLNRLSQKKKLPPILYGWTEAFACAGHAVLLSGQSSCLECGFTGDSFNNAITVWEGNTLQQTPACGQTFQPYGEIELQNITAMIAGAAVDFLAGKDTTDFHRIWLGSTRLLAENGGKWSEAIQSQAINKNPNGSLSLSGKWTHSTACLTCNNPKFDNEISSTKQA